MIESKLKVLGIAGSPRRNGNTDLLLQEAVKGAVSKGAESRTIVLAEMNIAPCRHCDGCIETGRCVIDDDMQLVHQLLREADRLILASPIFFMGLTAQTKAMVDRCQALWALKYLLKLPVAVNSGGERKGAFISVGGTGVSNLFQPAIATVKILFKTLEVSYSDDLLFPRIDEKGAIAQHPTALSQAFALGQKLAEG
jgi:multimeric flavodoxin WrbA